jgi:hypothetical protein
MKVYIGPYVNRWVSCVHDRYMKKKYDVYTDWPETQTRFENFLEKTEDVLQWIYNRSINLYLDRKEQKVKVRIDRYDTWSMDHTLAPIILSMLKQLKETKQGAPNVDMTDVPEELRINDPESKAFRSNGETDEKFFDRWDWIMDEMIWAFEQKCRDHWEEDYYGPYIQSEDGSIMGGRFEWTDDEGRKAHQERMSNGFRLFGKYYENLWD